MRRTSYVLLTLALLLSTGHAFAQEVSTDEQRLRELKRLGAAKLKGRFGAAAEEYRKRVESLGKNSVKDGLVRKSEFDSLDRAVFADPLDAGFPAGAWWRDAEFAKTLDLTADQQKRMEDVFAQHRIRLIELNAGLVREEAVLRPLVADVRAEDESRILAQIDRVAQARADLEKTNARMLLGLRQVLSQDQWTKLSKANLKQAPILNLKK